MRAAVQSQSASMRGRSAALWPVCNARSVGVSIRFDARKVGSPMSDAFADFVEVSIRFDARKVGSLKEQASTNLFLVSIRFDARKVGSRYQKFRCRNCGEFNPLRCAEGRQPRQQHAPAQRHRVSIRFDARKVGSLSRAAARRHRLRLNPLRCAEGRQPVQAAESGSDGSSQSASMRGRSAAITPLPMSVESLSQSASMRGRSAARSKPSCSTSRRRLNPLRCAEGRQPNDHVWGTVDISSQSASMRGRSAAATDTRVGSGKCLNPLRCAEGRQP